MKKLIVYVLSAILSITIIPNQINAASATQSTSPTEAGRSQPLDSLAIKAAISRLDEIRAMDKSALKYSERKELRNESNNLNAEIKNSSSGLYLSGAAIILIIVLIILL